MSPEPGASPRSRYPSLWGVATLGLFLFGAGRIAALVLQSPLIGYANNFDFYRIAAWFGISTTPTDVLPMNPAAPIALYFVGAPGYRIEDAYLSSELVFVAPVVAVTKLFALGDGPLPAFDIRVLGALRATLLIVGAGAIVIRLRKRSEQAGAVAALAFAAVFADPVVTLFLNTLYCEFSALFFGSGALLGLLLVCRSARPRTVTVVGTCLAFLGLGLSKFQYQALPAALLATAMLAGSWRHWRASIALGVAAVVPLLVQNRERPPGLETAIVMCNATNTWLGAVLPALGDPQAAVTRLGLPDRCRQHVGKHWYSPGMQPPPCPEVAALSRTAAVGLLVAEPAAAFRLFSRALSVSRPFIIQSYGQVEGKRDVSITSIAPVVSFGVNTLAHHLPEPVYFGIVFVISGFAPLAISVTLFRRLRGKPREPSTVRLVALLLSTTLGYSLVTSVLGDGLIGVAQHFFLGEVALFPALIALMADAAGGLRALAASRRSG